jgi:hypothetical protein
LTVPTRTPSVLSALIRTRMLPVALPVVVPG